ncbi:MAG: hypothetical protein LQ349_001124, partial [Xanthoria aureola]
METRLGQKLAVENPASISAESEVIDWSDLGEKRTFERISKSVLQIWGGVSPAHRGTCILAFQDRSSSDLVGILNAQEPYSLKMMPLVYRTGDHETTLASATARFRSRDGRHSGSDQYKLMEVSHPCAHDLCIVHSLYEPVSVKKDRESCFFKAEQARLRNLPITQLYSKHNFPCLLQHAALNMTEVIHIQLNILGQAIGTYQPPSIQKPIWWLYDTFETKLPLTWDIGSTGLTLDPSHLAVKASLGNTSQRPDLSYVFCYAGTLFQPFTTLWTHIFHAHLTVDKARRLYEIQRTARLWRKYSKNSKPIDRPVRQDMDKLKQAHSPTFSWEN